MQRQKSYRAIWIILLILAVITPVIFISPVEANRRDKPQTRNKGVAKDKAPADNSPTKKGSVPVLIELYDAPGVIHKVAAEKIGQRMSAKDIVAYSLRLFGKQDAFLALLAQRRINARMRVENVRQIDGSMRRIEYRFSYLLNGFVAYVSQGDLRRLRQMPEVAGVYEFPRVEFFLDRAIDYSLGTQTTPAERRDAVYGATKEFQPVNPNDPMHPEAPRLTKIDGFEGQNMNIAVIDSGVDYRHPMFGGIGQATALPRVSGQPESAGDNKKVIYFYAFSQPVGDPTDDFGHGTLVASTAAGYAVDGNTPPRTGYGTGTTGLGVGPTPNGVMLLGMAPQAKIMAYKVCGPAPQCAGDIELSIEDAASPVTLTGQGDGGSIPTMVSKPVADVINLSLGDTGGDPAGPSARAANNAALAGTIVVASAGNAGPGLGTIGAPSAATLAISVAASLDPGSVAGADVLLPNQIPAETCDTAETPRAPTCDTGTHPPGPPEETGASSNANAADTGQRQGIRIFPVAGGGPLPTETNPGQPTENTPSLSAHYVFVDRRNMANPIPTSVTNRIAVVKFSGAFAAAANSIAPANPAAILLITATESATAVVVVGGIPTFTIGNNDGEYLLDLLSSTDNDVGDPPNGAVSERPLRLAESISLAAFQGAMAGFSSRGPNDHANARFRTIKPDVTGPGVSIQGAATVEGLPDDTIGLSSTTGYTQANGTSFSGPITAGAVTLVRQRVRELGFDSTTVGAMDYRTKRFDTVTISRALLQNSATNLRNGLGVPETDPAPTTNLNDLGSGHINVAGALTANAIMVSPTDLLANPREFTAPAPPPSPTPFPVLIPTASFGAVPVVGVNAVVVRTREVIIRDITGGTGGGAYNLTIENNRRIDNPGFDESIVASASSAVPITSINVPAGGQASFFVRVAVDGNQVTIDPTEFMWYVSATQASSSQKLRMPFYYRAIGANLPNIAAPNQAPPENTEIPAPPPPGPECPGDTDGNYRLRWTYTPPAPTPSPIPNPPPAGTLVGFRIQEGTRSETVFFDPADEMLVNGANSRWMGSPQWTTQTNPETGSPAYFVPDTAEQNESLTMINAITLPAGGATMSFTTNQDIEQDFDFGFVDIIPDGGGVATTVATYTGSFVGSRTIDLTPFAGQAVRVRFRMTSDMLVPALGWYVEDIRISSDDFATLANVGPTQFTLDITGRPDGTYFYRVAGVFTSELGNVPGPYSNARCVTVSLGGVQLGNVIISEFRFRGPGGTTDEFIELYNATDSAITVGTADGSPGWAIVASNGTVITIIPRNTTTIPARGHYLVANSSGYSLGSYGAADTLYTQDIPDNGGVAVFRSSTSLTLGNRLDAAGFNTVMDLYREGAGIPPITPDANPANNEFTFVRNMFTGLPKDTGNNSADFTFVSTSGAAFGRTGAPGAPDGPSELGAPGPENRMSPIQRNATIKASLIDFGCAGFGSPTSACARVRTSEGANPQNAAFGTLLIRRRITNKTGQTITRLRFRAVNITTLNSPGYSPSGSQADVRILNSTGGPKTTTSGPPVTVLATTIETPPAQPNGGGNNTTLTVMLTPSLAPDASIDVEFRLGVQRDGNFRFLLNFEALP